MRHWIIHLTKGHGIHCLLFGCHRPYWHGKNYRPVKERNAELAGRKCHWCDYTGHPTNVLYHEVMEHQA